MTVPGSFVLAAARLTSVLNRRPGWLAVQKYFVAAVLAGLAVLLLIGIGPSSPVMVHRRLRLLSDAARGSVKIDGLEG
jgi:uncharacterized protein YbjT (DUF2867 family)